VRYIQDAIKVPTAEHLGYGARRDEVVERGRWDSGHCSGAIGLRRTGRSPAVLSAADTASG
jgi:hypothetical protein